MSEFSTDQIARGLERASDDIKREVGALIPIAADRMVSALERRYPLGRVPHSGVPHMRDDIRVRSLLGSDVMLAGRKVTGPRLVYIWQDGTRERVDATRGNARRGRMPAADPKFFERTAVQTREDLMQQARVILDRPRTIDA